MCDCVCACVLCLFMEVVLLVLALRLPLCLNECCYVNVSIVAVSECGIKLRLCLLVAYWLLCTSICLWVGVFVGGLCILAETFRGRTGKNAGLGTAKQRAGLSYVSDIILSLPSWSNQKHNEPQRTHTLARTYGHTKFTTRC